MKLESSFQLNDPPCTKKNLDVHAPMICRNQIAFFYHFDCIRSFEVNYLRSVNVKYRHSVCLMVKPLLVMFHVLPLIEIEF